MKKKPVYSKAPLILLAVPFILSVISIVIYKHCVNAVYQGADDAANLESIKLLFFSPALAYAALAAIVIALLVNRKLISSLISTAGWALGSVFTIAPFAYCTYFPTEHYKISKAFGWVFDFADTGVGSGPNYEGMFIAMIPCLVFAAVLCIAVTVFAFVDDKAKAKKSQQNAKANTPKKEKATAEKNSK